VAAPSGEPLVDAALAGGAGCGESSFLPSLPLLLAARVLTRLRRLQEAASEAREPANADDWLAAARWAAQTACMLATIAAGRGAGLSARSIARGRE
jgi:hypothetical protein